MTPCIGGFVLNKQPVGICVNFPDEMWQTGAFASTWDISLLACEQKLVAVSTFRHVGVYFLVPDFASTARMAQGQSLPALFYCVDADPVAAYVILSSTTELQTIAIVQPFSSRLFRSCPPLGQLLSLSKFVQAAKGSQN